MTLIEEAPVFHAIPEFELASGRSAAVSENESLSTDDAVAELIRVKNLRISFDTHDSETGKVVRREVVKGISFSIAPGEIVGIVGESGSGKSVTVRSLLGLNSSNQTTLADHLEVFGRDARTLNERQWATIRGSHIGFVLQDALSSLDPLKTVGKEVAEALAPHTRFSFRGNVRSVHALLEDVGIPEPEVRAQQYSHELSGGLRQRALIASALAQDPALIIADEPTTALDVTVQAQVLDLLRKKAAEGHALILVSHDLAVIGSVCDRIIVMKDGEIVEEGRSADILTHPRERYTQLLLAAIPSAESRGYRLSSVEPVLLPDRKNTNQDLILVGTDITKEFVGRHGSRILAVDHATIELFAGQTLGVVGESGSGKSTLARIIAGLLTPDAGTITLDELPWAPLPERARRARRSQIQVVAQNPLASFDPRYTVSALISEPLKALTNASRAEISERVAQVLELVQLPTSIADSSPRYLSGGQQQRVAIARAIATRPRILVADEAVSALDVSIQAQILDLLADIQARTGISILFISHDLGVIHHISDTIVVMRQGRIVEQGLPDDVLVRPNHRYTQELIASLPRLPSRRSTVHSSIHAL